MLDKIEIDGEKRIVASNDMFFRLPEGITLFVKKGEIGAVCDDETCVSDDSWATREASLKNTTLEGKVLALGDVSVEGCRIEHILEANSNLKEYIYIDGKTVLYHSFIKGNFIRIRNSNIKNGNILRGSEIINANIHDSSVSDFCLICDQATVTESTISEHTEITGKNTIQNSIIRNNSKISGNAEVENCTIEKSYIRGDVVVKGNTTGLKPSITDSTVCDNAAIEGGNISIVSSFVRGDFKIGSNVFIIGSSFDCDNSSHILAGINGGRIVIMDAKIRSPFDYFVFKAAKNRLYTIYAGDGLKGGYAIRKWYPRNETKPVPSYPVSINFMQEICGKTKSTKKEHRWANSFVWGLTDKDVGRYIKKQTGILTKLFGNVEFFRSTEYKDLLLWSTIQFASNVLTNEKEEKHIIETSNIIESDIVIDIIKKKPEFVSRLFVTKKVFDKICYDSKKSPEEVFNMLDKEGCVFVDFEK